MLYSIIEKRSFTNLNELVSLQNKANEVGSEDKLGKQNYHHNMKKLYEQLTYTIKNTSENLTITITETSFRNDKTNSDLNEKVWEKMNDTGMIAPCLASSLVNLLKPENTSQINLIKDPSSISVEHFFFGIAICWLLEVVLYPLN